MIRLVLNKQSVIDLSSVEELRVLARKYKGNLPYKVVLETDNEQEIRKLERLKIPYTLEWEGAWE